MRKIAANLIYTMHKEPLKNGYLVVDNKGYIMQVVNTGGEIPELAGLEYYNGIIVPGFIDLKSSVELPEDMKYLELSHNIEKRFLTHHEYSNSEAIEALKKKLRWQFIYGAQVISNLYPTNNLSPFEELKLQKTESFEQKLAELTIENAKYLHLDNELGSIQKNKKPGLLLVSGFNLKNNTFTDSTSIKRLV